MEMLFEIHQGLPREGPGNSESTLRALSMLGDIPENPRILDIGCGPGQQTFDLLTSVSGNVTALDFHYPYLRILGDRADDKMMDRQVTCVQADMVSLPFHKRSFDILWAEGSIYIVGFYRGLRMWRRFLKPGGYMVASELTWLQSRTPAMVRAFWEKNYPDMRDVQGNLEQARRAGFCTVGHFTLPESAWWKDYYLHLEKRLSTLVESYSDHPEALDMLREEQKEIDLYRSYSDYYGYVFYVLQKPH
jgi:ubiquinone/menaquinone biosynthesis C-methylase UbiE